MRGKRRSRARRGGMTLIEIMIVIVLLAIVASGVTYSFNALNRTYLRSACMRITAAARYAYNRAVARNTTVRLVFDLDAGTMGFEESEIPVTLARLGDERREFSRDQAHEDGEGDGRDVDSGGRRSPGRRARAPRRHDPSDLRRVALRDAPGKPLLTARARLGRVDHAPLHAPRGRVPRRGRGPHLLLPHGQTENAVVWLDDGHDHTYSVELHPLTGRTRIRSFAYEPEELILEGEEDSSEVDD